MQAIMSSIQPCLFKPTAKHYTGSSIAGLPRFTLQPSSVTISDGDDVEFTVNAVDAVSLQWQINDGTGWDDIVGETSTTLSLPAYPEADAGLLYRCVATNGIGTKNSGVATVFIAEATSFVALENGTAMQIESGSELSLEG